MRSLYFIVTMIVIGLSLMPCRDSGIAGKPGTTLSVNKASDNHTHKQDQDQCSPFCQCACCNVPSVSRINAFLIIPPLRAETTYTDILPAKILKSSISIWQPPKVLS